MGKNVNNSIQCRSFKISLGIVCMMVCLSNYTIAKSNWQAAKGPLMTRWAGEVTPEKVHSEYPRPQMVREEWFNLNGLWDYAIRPKGENFPERYDGQILVPFPIESALSGVMKPVGEDKSVWYRRTFELELEGIAEVMTHFHLTLPAH